MFAEEVKMQSPCTKAKELASTRNPLLHGLCCLVKDVKMRSKGEHDLDVAVQHRR